MLAEGVICVSGTRGMVIYFLYTALFYIAGTVLFDFIFYVLYCVTAIQLVNFVFFDSCYQTLACN